jgi:hypothetical protein
VDILLRICLLFFTASLITEIIFNLVVLPAKDTREKENPDELVGADAKGLRRLYRRNLPPILQKAPVLSLTVEFGGTVFFVVFGVVFLLFVYNESNSLAWTLGCVPGLVFLYYLCSLVGILLATLLMRSVRENEESDS